MPNIEPARLVAEFFVIVVGVLVALGVDEWREDARDRSAEATYVERLVADLVSDSSAAVRTALIGTRKVEALDAVIARMEDPAMVRQTPSAAWPDLAFAYSQPQLQTTTFDELTSVGGLSLIRDPGLRFKIGDHYRTVLGDAYRLDQRRSALVRVVAEVYPPVEGLPNPLDLGVPGAEWAAKIDSSFFAGPNVPRRLERLLSTEYQGLLYQERAYAESMQQIGGEIAGSTSSLLAVLRAYQSH